MITKVHFGFNVNLFGETRIEVPIKPENIDTVLKVLNDNKILFFMGFNFKKYNCRICDRQPDCKICVQGQDHISGNTPCHLFFIRRAILKCIANNIGNKYGK